MDVRLIDLPLKGYYFTWTSSFQKLVSFSIWGASWRLFLFLRVVEDSWKNDGVVETNAMVSYKIKVKLLKDKLKVCSIENQKVQIYNKVELQSTWLISSVWWTVGCLLLCSSLLGFHLEGYHRD